MAEEKTAKRVYSLDDIKFNEENKVLAMVSWIFIVGVIMLFIEKKDTFVRYSAAQSTIVALLGLVTLIPVIGWVLAPFIGLLTAIITLVGMIKAYKGERFDVPGVSGLALKLMGYVQ